ncbi:MAG: hypothetical protein RBS81_07665 [Tenuifilaceae bacterium]|jgi:hypothetical protein|nr:hypothetical protein [Tenuifilaceae bacterium]
MSEIEKIGRSLENMEKRNPFSTPNGYFEELPTRVQEYCQPTTTTQSVSAGIINTLKAQFALVAGFCFLALMSYWGYYLVNPSLNGPEVTSSDYVNIISKHVAEFDEAQLVEAVGELEPVNVYDSIRKKDISDEMIEYLLEENVDYVSLMEQYK